MDENVLDEWAPETDFEQVVKDYAVNEIESLRHRVSELQDQLTEVPTLFRKLATSQARIDALMFEFCPEEMEPEQLDRWANSQEAIE